MFDIHFIRENVTVSSDGSETIQEIMRRSGLAVNAPCGGMGRCGKCRVSVRRLSDTAPAQTCLACQTTADQEMWIDTFSQIHEEVSRILTAGISHGIHFDPVVRQYCLTMPPCPAGKSTSDWTRFEAALREVSGAQVPYRVNPSLASGLSTLCKDNAGRIYALTFEDSVLAAAASPMRVYLAAFDIGTTTVAAYLLDGSDGHTAAVASRMNPQAAYGADVINRANYVLEHGSREVTSCIRETVNEMLGELADQAHISRNEIRAVSIVGNTCMHHLFLGISPDSLVHAPYNPAVSEAMILNCADYGLQTCDPAPDSCPGISETPLLLLPNIAGFVGADTVGCLISTDLAEQEDWTLLIDIGTNGEMVLGRQHDLAACSTAAGPAFEGAGITCGMRGSEGAISKAQWTGDAWQLKTIGHVPPRGICGSGLLDLAAQLLLSGQMDETGQMAASPLLLSDPKVSGTEVVLTQKDIRQLQLAKAAIASGIRLLAEKQQIRIDQIAHVWLAGAFGSFLSPASAAAIGLIPPELSGRIEAVGNAAGEGAKAVLLDSSCWLKASRLARETDFIELAVMPQFQDTFVDELMFPEQDG